MKVAGYLPRKRFSEMLAALQQCGYRLVGPMLRDGAIVYSEFAAVEELPAGASIESGPGRVRASQENHPRLFAWANGPQAVKPLLFKPVETLWQVERQGQDSLDFRSPEVDVAPVAVIGVRACDLAALQLHDQHFLHGACRDTHYASRRERLLLIAVNCTHPADTCFCASTGDGPAVTDNFDILLDELDEGYLVRAGSDQGKQIVASLVLQDASLQQTRQADNQVQAAADMQTRGIPPGNLYERLFAQAEHPRWSQVADRCLACGNCTQVCPTCFCSREQDETRLDGTASTHLRLWDSCFNEGHSYITGLVIRSEVKHRYRQWLTHKLGSWFVQYGRSGCVGCGRCIAWCPVGIDICEEVNAIVGDEA